MTEEENNQEENNEKPKKSKRQNVKASGRSGYPPPDNNGKTYERHTPRELDRRRFNKRPDTYTKISYDLLVNLCKIGCTINEVETATGFNHKTIDRYLSEFHGVSWAEFFKEHADRFKISLRRLQLRSAEGEYDEKGKKYTVYPSVPMQIWLGKQFLDQKDKHENIFEDKTNIPQFEWADAKDVTNQKYLDSHDDEEIEEEDE